MIFHKHVINSNYNLTNKLINFLLSLKNYDTLSDLILLLEVKWKLLHKSIKLLHLISNNYTIFGILKFINYTYIIVNIFQNYINFIYKYLSYENKLLLNVFKYNQGFSFC